MAHGGFISPDPWADQQRRQTSNSVSEVADDASSNAHASSSEESQVAQPQPSALPDGADGPVEQQPQVETEQPATRQENAQEVASASSGKPGPSSKSGKKK